ncbi:inovirus Gp2 family protein [Aeromonas rivuli]|uniref:inovirus Gp2 family protein n=1 Tax=Aeromonas rivuli TaxID=648794 RepID=UPI001CCB43B1|nr:inovirus Gp2 family protein [Aeromonas rivuli]UBO72984.1 inovirus Gp2 family protein [Aeromonas rivuli]
MKNIHTTQGYQLNDNEIISLQEKVGKWYDNISRPYLTRILDVVYAALARFPRVWAIRVDLRFAQDISDESPDLLMCLQRTDHKVITRFFASLKSQLREVHRRKGKTGTPDLFEYIWVREQDGGGYPHYHLALLFNKDEYAFLGDYRDSGADNMATRIQKAWCSALGLEYPHYASLVHFPKNGVYVIDKRSATVHSESYLNFLIRIAYLAKVYTKDINDGYRNIGCSQ